MNDSASATLEAASKHTHSLTSRLLHLGVAVGVILQLLLSTGMARPKPDAVRSTLESLAFEMHEFLGLLMLALILTWLVWLVRRRGEAVLSELFPWTGHAGRTALTLSLRIAMRQARRGILAAETEIQPLIKTVHGLGIACIALMACSGALVWLGMDDSGNMPQWTHLVLEFHQFMATFAWIYLGGHAGMALLHQLRGDDTLASMFSLRR
ncbi:MAG: cytochrome b/b6 domain-containing protein [Candidatus Thiodiazotropha sp.]